MSPFKILSFKLLFIPQEKQGTISNENDNKVGNEMDIHHDMIDDDFVDDDDV